MGKCGSDLLKNNHANAKDLFFHHAGALGIVYRGEGDGKTWIQLPSKFQRLYGFFDANRTKVRTSRLQGRMASRVVGGGFGDPCAFAWHVIG